MAMLHTVNKSPFEKNSLDSCIDHALKGSSILLFEDGVYGALKGTTISDKVSQAMGNVSVYVLGSDLRARGLSEERIIEGITVTDYPGFVDLAGSHDNVQSWL
jgi:tRNA 2-thiouridine synthesizing protein B